LRDRPCADLGHHQLMQATITGWSCEPHTPAHMKYSPGMCEILLADSLIPWLPDGPAHGTRLVPLRRILNAIAKFARPTSYSGKRYARHQAVRRTICGVPDTSEEDLESMHTAIDMVYRFKRGFGGELRRAAGPWDRVYQPVLYQMYLLWLKVRKVEG
jgi:hypothetical protein